MRHLTAYAFCASIVLTSVSAFAGDGTVPASTLRSLGLGEMQVLSDAEGIQIRGMSGSNAHARGLANVTLLLFDPATGSNASAIQGTSALRKLSFSASAHPTPSNALFEKGPARRTRCSAGFAAIG